jgi:autotransporter-associated beta strand protein
MTVAFGATVQIGNNDAAGTLPSGTLDNEGTLVYDRSDNIQVGTAIPGAGALVQNGSGRLALSASSSYSGNTTVNSGTLALTNSGAIASSAAVTINSNATLDVSGVTTSATLQALNLSNATVNVKVGYLQTNFNVSSLTLSGSTNVINVRSLPPIAYYPATNVLLQSPSAITGNNNLGLGSLPSASPAYVGTIMLSADQTTVLLALTAGPIGVRSTVNWSGADALTGVSTNWSDAQNWQTPGVPVAAEKIVFNNTATASGTPFDLPGDGVGGVVNPANIDNIVDLNATNAGINYANSGFHNTLVNPGKTLALTGSLTVNGSGGGVAILGTNGALVMSNPVNSTTLGVENGTTPTLDLSGIDTFMATVNQVGVGFNPSGGAFGSGTCYLARTNIISTGFGNSGSGSSLVVSGSASSATGQFFLGQSNALFLDGVTMGIGQSVNNLIAFNPAVTNQNPYAFIRGITGNSSRVTRWSIGDATVNLNNGADGSGHVVDFTGGTLNALIGTLIVGQGAQGNTFNTQVMGTFNMGAGNLDVTSLQVGAGDDGKNGGTGIGIMNVTGGTLIASTLNLAVGGPTNTAGTLNLTNATTVLSNGVTIGANTAGGTLSVIDSTLKVLNGTLGTPSLPLTALNLDGATLQLNADASAAAANVVCSNIVAANTTTINIPSAVNVSGSAQIPLISYSGSSADPYPNLALGTTPAGYTVGNGGLLVDNTANLTIDVILSSAAPSTNASILSVTLSGTNLVIHGTNNNGGQNFRYAVLTSTNLTLPLSSWTSLGTNQFKSDGTFDYTNAIVPSQPKAFFDIQVVP